MLQRAALVALIEAMYLGAFSRLTSGRYTPNFYRYQLDRAPNAGAARLIPLGDLTLGTLLYFPRTRRVGALLCAGFQGLGIVMRLREGKEVWGDSLLFGMAVALSFQGYGIWEDDDLD
ncbi:hypothetical protein B0H67DRAFT_480248 [Lasiosphaeris hirsuta]|uniref:Uncharacterized protein n=1 Tax=Lasiosphaeris hirsuta TaxID=260670 RepID=A0AA40E6H2_9PEZI|nr:hypothetical protein B0H67DRAFT_480248 [Lasiosphaeris hirsuta]